VAACMMGNHRGLPLQLKNYSWRIGAIVIFIFALVAALLRCAGLHGNLELVLLLDKLEGNPFQDLLELPQDLQRNVPV
jgi:hypothetical protein